MIDPNELKSLFEKHPEAIIQDLIQQHALKGKYRDILNAYLAENMHEARWQKFLWLILLPRRLSVVTVDNFCNLACRMCGGSKGKMEWLKPESLVKMLAHCPTTEVITFVAGNSEPMLNPDIAENFRILNEYQINSTFVTNGHYLNRKNISAMIEHQQPKSLNVSLDAINPDVYKDIRGADNSKVLDGLNDLLLAKKEAGVRFPEVSLLMVGMEDNIADLSDFVSLAHKTGAVRVHVDHMLGSYSPGDFTLNPNWRKYMSDALALADDLGVLLQVPLDSMQILLREGHLSEKALSSKEALIVEEVSEFHDGASCGMKVVSNQEDLSQTESEPSVRHCPWLQDVHVHIDGSMSPCCNTPAGLGNIINQPLWENELFLETRIRHGKGEIERLCLKNKNCIYVQEIENNDLKVKYFRRESLLRTIQSKATKEI